MPLRVLLRSLACADDFLKDAAKLGEFYGFGKERRGAGSDDVWMRGVEFPGEKDDLGSREA